MGTITQECIARRNAAAIEDWYEGHFTYSEIEDKYGITRSGFSKIIHLYENQYGSRERKPRTRPPVQLCAGRRPLSRAHAMVGVAVSRYIEENGLEAAQFSEQLMAIDGSGGLSSAKLNQLRAGIHELPLKMVQNLAQLLRVSVADLLEGKELLVVD